MRSSPTTKLFQVKAAKAQLLCQKETEAGAHRPCPAGGLTLGFYADISNHQTFVGGWMLSLWPESTVVPSQSHPRRHEAAHALSDF